LLHLAPTLDDHRELKGGSHPVRPLRLCDLAVDQFVRKLKLKTTFPLRIGHPYEARGVSEVKRLVAAALASQRATP
jgi:hypothetical protein